MQYKHQRVEQIRQQIREPYGQLQQLIEGPLAEVPETQLHEQILPGEWTIMQSLAHIVEFLPYWAREFEKLVKAPGNAFGRTHTHEGRLQAVREHAADSLQQIRSNLPESYADLDTVLATLSERDLELTGLHPKYGERTLDWFINEFVTIHLVEHLQQIQACLHALTEKQG